MTSGKQPVLAMPPLAVEAKPAATGVKEGNDALMAAFAKGNTAAAVAVYSDDAILFPPHKTRVTGRKAIEAFWREAMKAGICKK